MDLQYLLGVQRKALQHKARRPNNHAMPQLFTGPLVCLSLWRRTPSSRCSLIVSSQPSLTRVSHGTSRSLQRSAAPQVLCQGMTLPRGPSMPLQPSLQTSSPTSSASFRTPRTRPGGMGLSARRSPMRSSVVTPRSTACPPSKASLYSTRCSLRRRRHHRMPTLRPASSSSYMIRLVPMLREATVASSPLRHCPAAALQIDFLTAELLRRDPGVAPRGGEPVYGRTTSSSRGPGRGGSDEVSEAAALELEVARLATQLRTALGAQQRAEDTASALQAEVRERRAAEAFRARPDLHVLFSQLDAARTSLASTSASDARNGSDGAAATLGNGRHNALLAASRADEHAAELAALRADAEDARRAVQQLQHDQAAFAAAADAAAAERQSAAAQVTRLEALVSALTQQLHTSAGALAGCQAELHSARQDAGAAEARCQALVAQQQNARSALASFERDSEDLRARLRQAEAEVSSLRPVVRQQADDNASLRQRLGDAQGALELTEADLHSAAAERESLRRQLHTTSDASDQASGTVAALRRDTGTLKQEIAGLTDALRAAQSAAVAARNDAERAAEAVEEHAARAAALEAELAATARRLEEMTSAASNAEQRCARLQESLGVADEVPVLRQELAAVRRKATDAEIRGDATARALLSSETRRAELERELVSLRSALDVASSSHAALGRELGAQRAATEAAEARLAAEVDELDHARSMIRVAEDGARGLRDAEAVSRRDLQDAQARVDALQAAIATERDRCDAAAAALATARAEVERLASALHGSQRQYADAQRSAEELQGQLSEARREGSATLGSLAVLRSRAEAAAAEAASASKRAEAADQRSLGLERDVEQLKALLLQVDGTREALTRQLAAALSRLDQADRACDELSRQMRLAEQAGAESRAREASLQDDIRAVRADRDGSRQEAATAAASLADAQASIAEHQRAAVGLSAQVSSLRDECARIAALLAARDDRLASQAAAIEELASGARDLAAARDAAHSELASAAGDIAAVSRENQVLAGEISSGRAREEGLQAALDASRSSVASLQVRLSAADRELHDALAMYSSIVEERAALLAEVDAGEALRAQLQEQAAGLFSENGDLRAHLEVTLSEKANAEEAAASLERVVQATALDLQVSSGPGAFLSCRPAPPLPISATLTLPFGAGHSGRPLCRRRRIFRSRQRG